MMVLSAKDLVLYNNRQDLIFFDINNWLFGKCYFTLH